jgi:NADH-quinone oxidoreductase subunit H
LADRSIEWATSEVSVIIAAGMATVILALWTVTTAGLTSWTDRRIRARMEGRIGPRHWGPAGILQGLSDWVKLMLRRGAWTPSAVAAALSGALVLGALSMLPLGPWGRIADPAWGLLAIAGLLALSTLPLAIAADPSKRLLSVSEAAGTSVVLLLAVAAPMLIAETGGATDLVTFQEGNGWGVLLAPLGILLFLVVMYWEAQRLHRMRGTSRSREGLPGPHQALARYAVAARYYALGALGAVVFLGGWSGPGPDGFWWTLVKAYALIGLASMFAAAMPQAGPGQVAHSVRRRWLPVAALNLAVVSAVLEVMA